MENPCSSVVSPRVGGSRSGNDSHKKEQLESKKKTANIASRRRMAVSRKEFSYYRISAPTPSRLRDGFLKRVDLMDFSVDWFVFSDYHLRVCIGIQPSRYGL